jgi:hypothetical protein
MSLRSKANGTDYNTPHLRSRLERLPSSAKQGMERRGGESKYTRYRGQLHRGRKEGEKVSTLSREKASDREGLKWPRIDRARCSGEMLVSADTRTGGRTEHRVA